VSFRAALACGAQLGPLHRAVSAEDIAFLQYTGGTTGVDTLFKALLSHPVFARLDFSRLKLGVAGGMPLRPATAEKWRAVTGRPLAEGYGLTEASPRRTYRRCKIVATASAW
jgi:acyl-CoA synthetase (AMP-forming)/AMP-acid ligase II